MGKTIILTTANIEENSNNTKLVYNFPSGGYTFKNDMIALQSVYQYFSIFNITSDYGNNTFSYRIHGLMELNTLSRFQMDIMKLVI